MLSDIWFHRYDENGKDIEGRCKRHLRKLDVRFCANQKIDDYNSWQESLIGHWKRRRLDKEIILAEGRLLCPVQLSATY